MIVLNSSGSNDKVLVGLQFQVSQLGQGLRDDSIWLKMSSALLCILLCLGSLTVMAQMPGVFRRPGRLPRPSPLSAPKKMPWPGQQCINARLGYAGICAGSPNICSSLICAYPNGRGEFVPGKYRPALPGTVCGPFMVCRFGLSNSASGTDGSVYIWDVK